MDDILKKTMFGEVRELFNELEEIIKKYSAEEEVAYLASFGLMTDESTETEHHWQMGYSWNVSSDDEFDEIQYLQREAYLIETEDDSDGLTFQASLN
jgi:hypothetical protein